MSQNKAKRASNQDFDAVCHWYQVEFALYCFEVVRDTIEVILKKKLGERDLEYYAMTVGLICTYARPFTNNRPVGKLDADIVPQEFEQLHSHLITMRDQLFAHADATLEAALKNHLRADSNRP